MIQTIRNYRLIFFTLAAVALALTGASNTHAAEPPASIALVKNMYIGNQQGYTNESNCEKQDISLNWNPAINGNPYYYKDSHTYNNSNIQTKSDIDTFMTDMLDYDNYAFAVSQRMNYQNGWYNVDITLFQKNTPLLVVQPNNSYPDTYLRSTQNTRKYAYYLHPGWGCRHQSTYTHNATTLNEIANSNPTQLPLFYVNSDNITYPDGYTGQPLPTTYIPPSTEEGNTTFDYKVQDRSVALTNTTKNLRGDEECRWYVNTNPAEEYVEGDVLNDQIISRDCNAIPTYTFEQYGYYEVSLSITYPNGLDGQSDQDTWDAYTVLHIDGSSYSGTGDIHGDLPTVEDMFTECFSEDFPFIDIPGCIGNFTTTFQFLAFGKVEFPTWTYHPTCTQLNTMDDWLNLPDGYTVCPQFPAHVRNIVTPFVAFMLGIVTLGFINRHNQGVSGGNK